MLSDSESDSENLHHLTINEHYAKAFAYRKEREELEKLKAKYGSDAEEDDEISDTDSEEAESEDEHGEELTPAVDAAILRTLARIKRKDPAIYDSKTDVFEEEQKKTGSINLSRPSKDKSKPVTMRQVMLESALNATSRSPSPEPITHVEEQRMLRDETISVFHGAVAVDKGKEDSDDDDLLVLREKTKDELEKEEEEYRAFLKREVGENLANLVTVEESMVDSKDAEKVDRPKKKRKKDKDPGQKGSRSKQETDQEFLMNYILNRGWIDRSAQRIPTYREITDTKGKKKSPSKDDDHSDAEPSEGTSQNGNIEAGAEISADDEFEDLADAFESSYNFRFEEPDAAVIKTYPRVLPSLVRREDTTRKAARERRKQRKEEEILKRKEEVRRMKGLKMKGLRSKLERIGREAGKDVDKTKALQELDLDGEWDPDLHDRQMAGIYADDDDGIDEEKPQWEDDIDIGDIATLDDLNPKAVKKKKKKKIDEDAVTDGVDVDAMDADVAPVEDDEEWDGTEEMRKRKLGQYMDEIYGLEFNDIIGSMPTRFKYTTVQPRSYALTPAEILMATDTELNQYLSVKRYAPYRKDSRWDATRNSRLKELKQQISERGGGASADIDDAPPRPAKKRKGKSERLKMKAALAQSKEGAAASAADATSREGEPEVGKRKRGASGDGEGEGAGETEGGSKRRRRRKKKAVEE